MSADIEVQNHGSIFLLVPRSPRGEQWLEDNVDPEAQTWGKATACEPRYAYDIAMGAQNEGLVIV